MVATPFLKRRQQVLKPRNSPDMVNTLKPSLSYEWGQHRRNRQQARDRRFGRGPRPRQRHRMDCLGTWEIPHTSTWEQAGNRVAGYIDPGPEGTLRPFGSASCETRTEEGSVDPGSETNKW